MAYQSERPCIVSLDNLTEAASVGVNLALAEQQSFALTSPHDPGTTTGMYPPPPFEP